MTSVRPDLRLLIEYGVKARKQGRTAAAQAAFSEALTLDAEQPDALGMLGEMALAQGDAARAHELLTRALRAKPDYAHAWLRMGEAQMVLGLAHDAQASFARAAELQPDFIEALYNRARLLRALGEPAQAEACLRQALGSQRGSQTRAPTLWAQMLQLRALLQDDAGELGLALATLDQAIEGAPGRASLHHNRGVLLQRLSRAAEALAAHERALSLGLDSADAHYNRGNSLQSLGRGEEALASYRTALACDPQHALALYDSARLRWRLGHADFTQELDAAAAAAPQSALAPGIKARLLLRAGRDEQAALAYAQALACTDTVAAYHDGLGQALARLGRFEDALAAHRRAVALTPQHAAVHISHAGSLLRAGDVGQAAHVAENAVRLDPMDQQAWAFLGLTWRVAGDTASARDARDAWLNDYQQHVQVFDLAPPEGFADMASFNQALAIALAPMHSDAQAPIDQTLRQGSQTLGDIFDQGQPLVMQLKERIAQAVDRYIAHLHALPADDGHPLLGRTSSRWRFTDSWSSRLVSGGFHTPHVHPHGWISSCYYVALPTVMVASEGAATSQAGWIQFGAPDLAVPGHALTARRAVQPMVGRLVLFPSFMWHSTLPFTDSQPRLTVAFDVMPLA